MIFRSFKANNIVEYAITLALVGFVVGYAIYSINPKVFRDYFTSTFSNSQNTQNSTVTVGPITE